MADILKFPLAPDPVPDREFGNEEVFVSSANGFVHWSQDTIKQLNNDFIPWLGGHQSFYSKMSKSPYHLEIHILLCVEPSSR